jgi:hypothetical protein
VNAFAVTVFFLLFGVASACRAGNITYSVNEKIGAGGVMGNIVTDGTIGILATANIVGWDLMLNDGTTTFDVSGPRTPTNFADVDLADLSATASQLLFNFGAGNVGFLDIGQFNGPGFDAVCFSAEVNCQTWGGVGEGIGESVMLVPDNPTSTARSGIGTIGIATPEPNGGALVAAGIALLGFRKLKADAALSK